MDPAHDAARGGQSALERLMSALPGFKGYREKELRRDADRILRDHLAARLDLLKKPLNEAAAAATRSGPPDAINDIETARKRLDRVGNRIRYADRGYAPLFAVLKVDEDALARVYALDAALLEGVDAIGKAWATGEGGAAVKAMIAAIDALDARLSDRESLLRSAPAATVPCPKCRAPEPAGSKFCGTCGTPLAGAAPSVCAKCKTPLVPGSRFCGSCGEPVA